MKDQTQPSIPCRENEMSRRIIKQAIVSVAKNGITQDNSFYSAFAPELAHSPTVTVGVLVESDGVRDFLQRIGDMADLMYTSALDEVCMSLKLRSSLPSTCKCQAMPITG